MKPRILLLLIIIVSWFGSSPAFAAIPTGVKDAMKNGNAKELAKFFDKNVELSLLGEENVYSKAQAEQVIKAFFEKNPINNFTVLFEGGKDASQYAIGKIISGKHTFRFNILVKDQKILQLRIAEDEGN